MLAQAAISTPLHHHCPGDRSFPFLFAFVVDANNFPSSFLLPVQSGKVSILGHPAFSAECKADIEHALRIRVPPRDLILTPEGMANHPARCAKLDEIAGFCTKLGRTIPPGTLAAPYFIRDHQLTPETMQAIRTDIQRGGHIAGVAYKLEPVTDWMNIYRVGIYVH
jgi:hypothetical protein